jgi:hypothetical protein
MQRPNVDLLKRIDILSSAELAAIDDRARKLGVGGSHWEEAWLAARHGHRSAIPAYSRALSAGATPLAAAAIAGAVAAQQTDAMITQDQYETLVQPVTDAIAPGRQAIEAVASPSRAPLTGGNRGPWWPGRRCPWRAHRQQAKDAA